MDDKPASYPNGRCRKQSSPRTMAWLSGFQTACTRRGGSRSGQRGFSREARMLKATASLALLALAGLAASGAAAQEVVNLGPTKDNTLYENSSGDISNGQGEYLFSGRTKGSELRRPSLPSTRRPRSRPARRFKARPSRWLSHASRTTRRTRSSLHRLTADWGEGASDAPDEEGGGTSAEPGDATWLHSFYDSEPQLATFWAAEGGDYDGTSSASTSVGAARHLHLDVYGADAGRSGLARHAGFQLRLDPDRERSDRRIGQAVQLAPEPGAATRPLLAVTYTPPAATRRLLLTGRLVHGRRLRARAAPPRTLQWRRHELHAEPVPATAPGACCFADATCSEETATDCSAAGGIYQGDGTDCATASCPLLTGACCVPGNPGQLSGGLAEPVLGSRRRLPGTQHAMPGGPLPVRRPAAPARTCRPGESEAPPTTSR